jgi:hypothetical protein
MGRRYTGKERLEIDICSEKCRNAKDMEMLDIVELQAC